MIDEKADAAAAKRIYARAVAGGANIHVAFDLACASYRSVHPDMVPEALRNTVADGLGLPREDRIKIEIGASS
jgi:hypothetical protein